MKKSVLVLLLLLVGVSAQSLELGASAPCLKLEQVQLDSSIVERCIFDREPSQTHTLIEFFSITCSACKENHPKITALGQSLSDVATTRFVSIDRNKNQVIDYVNNHRKSYVFEVGLDPNRQARRVFNIRTTPTLIILNRDNQVVYRNEGVLTQANLTEIQSIVRAQ